MLTVDDAASMLASSPKVPVLGWTRFLWTGQSTERGRQSVSMFDSRFVRLTTRVAGLIVSNSAHRSATPNEAVIDPGSATFAKRR